jgi:hypothetical protein
MCSGDGMGRRPQAAGRSKVVCSQPHTRRKTRLAEDTLTRLSRASSLQDLKSRTQDLIMKALTLLKLVLLAYFTEKEKRGL